MQVPGYGYREENVFDDRALRDGTATPSEVFGKLAKTIDQMGKDEKYGMQEAAPVTGTDALLRKDLQVGRYYFCMLAKRNVLCIGGNQIKWYNEELDEYRTEHVSDYQVTERKGEL